MKKILIFVLVCLCFFAIEITSSHASDSWVTFDTFSGSGVVDTSKWGTTISGDSSATFTRQNGILQASLSAINLEDAFIFTKRPLIHDGIQSTITITSATGNDVQAHIDSQHWLFSGHLVVCRVTVNTDRVSWSCGYSPSDNSVPGDWLTIASGILLTENTIGQTYPVRLYFDGFTAYFEVIGRAQASYAAINMQMPPLGDYGSNVHIISHGAGTLTANFGPVLLYVPDTPPSTRVGYNPQWLILTLVSLLGVGGYLLRRRMEQQ